MEDANDVFNYFFADRNESYSWPTDMTAASYDNMIQSAGFGHVPNGYLTAVPHWAIPSTSPIVRGNVNVISSDTLRKIQKRPSTIEIRDLDCIPPALRPAYDELYRSGSYRSDNTFISHPVIDVELEIAAREEAKRQIDIDRKEQERRVKEWELKQLAMSQERKRKEESDRAERRAKEAKEMIVRLESIPMADQPKLLNKPLFKYQRQGLYWIIHKQKTLSGGCKGVILGDDMGAGKTIQAIAVCLESRVHMTLIAVPTSLVQQWLDQFSLHAPDSGFVFVVFHGVDRVDVLLKAMRRNNALQNPKDMIVITTHGLLSTGLKVKKMTREEQRSEDLANGIDAPPLSYYRSKTEHSIFDNPILTTKWDRFIIDEAHRMKNPKSNMAAAARLVQTNWILLISGTVLTNSRTDLYAQLLLMKHPVYSDRKVWNKLDKAAMGGVKASYASQEKAISELNALVNSVSLRRQKGMVLNGEVVAYVPPVTHRIVMLSLKSETAEGIFYKAVADSISAEFDILHRKALVQQNYIHILSLLMRLMQAACHPYLIGMRVVYSDKKFPKPNLIDWEAVNDVCQSMIDTYVKTGVLENMEKILKTDHSDMEDDDDSLEELDSVIPTRQDVADLEMSKNNAIEFAPSSSSAAENGIGDSGTVVDQKLTPINASSKLNALMCVLHEIEQTQDKIIIFSQFTRMLDIIENEISCKIDPSKMAVSRIDGSVGTSDRSKILESFKTNPVQRVILLSLKAGGVGLDLSVANHVVLFDPFWNLATELQAQGRVARIGQTKPVTVYRFIHEGTVDEHVEIVQARKNAEFREIGGGIFAESSGAPPSKHGKLSASDFKTMISPIARERKEKSLQRPLQTSK